MLRISKNTNKIVSIQMSTKQETTPEGYTPPEIDSFVIIPGVTQYQHIYTKGKWIVFDGKSSYIGVEFTSDSDLERFFVQLMREIKLNQITNVNVDIDTKSK
jgi:hypothetical protein